MKKYLSIIIVCLGLFGMLTAQNVWKPIGMEGEFLGVSSNGDIFCQWGYSGTYRSSDEGATWDSIYYLSYVRPGHFMINDLDRIFVFNENSHKLCYSDDNGDTWQEQATGISTNWVDGIFSLSNDTIFMANHDKFFWTVNGGESWDETPIDFIGDAQFGSILADHSGNVYVSAYSWYYPVAQTGIYTATLQDMTNWTMKEPYNVRDMQFDSDGSILAAYPGAFLYHDGVYLVDADRFVLTDDDVIFAMRRIDWDNEALFYSTDHGQTYIRCSENIPSTTTAPDSDLGLYKGRDNHIYCHGDVWEPEFETQFYKSIFDVNEIVKTYPNVLPEQYWYDLVTAQPEGYVADGQGNIHIYSAEALAWIISLSNGLNGAERDDFAGKTITLEADVDISEGIWTSIGTKNELPPSPPTKDDEFYFQGNFNGNGHIISGMATNEGFIGDIYNSRLENIVIKYAFAKDTEQGLLVNHFSNSVIDKCWLDCVVHVNDNGGYALFGYGGASTHITNCIFRSPLVDNPSGEIPHGSLCAFIEGNNAFNVVENCAIIVDSLAYPLVAPVVIQNNSGLMRNCYSYIGSFKNFDPQAFPYYDRYGIVGIDYGSVEHCYYNWLDPEVYGEGVNNPALFSHEDLDATLFRWVDEEWTLLEPVIIGGTETDDFNEALNAWTNTQANVSEYLQWHANYAVLPNGLPVLYVESNLFFPRGTEWYYEIKHQNGDITYQHLEYTADTAINSKRVKIITETNTMYDKSTWTDYEYIYEDGDWIYWWNKDLEDFTLLYDFGAEVGDEWEINGGWYTITVHVDGVEEMTIQGETYRVLHVTDPNYQLFTGDIICGIGHQKSFFPETPMAKDYEVDGLRCYWQDGELVLTMGEEDCDAVYYEIHGVEEGDDKGFVIYPNPSNGIITVETQGITSQQQEYRITNLLGQTVKSGYITTDHQQIDIHDLTEGMYFIIVGRKTKLLLKSL